MLLQVPALALPDLDQAFILYATGKMRNGSRSFGTSERTYIFAPVAYLSKYLGVATLLMGTSDSPLLSWEAFKVTFGVFSLSSEHTGSHNSLSTLSSSML